MLNEMKQTWYDQYQPQTMLRTTEQKKQSQQVLNQPTQPASKPVFESAKLPASPELPVLPELHASPKPPALPELPPREPPELSASQNLSVLSLQQSVQFSYLL